MNVSNPKIWMIISSYYPHIGGAEKQAQRISESLVHQGWNVSVLSRKHIPHFSHPLSSTETINNVPIVRINNPGKGIIASFTFIITGVVYLIRRGKGDIFHAHDVGAPGWLAVLARYLLRGRSIIKLRSGTLAYDLNYSSKLQKWQFLTLLRLADKVVVVNHQVEVYLNKLGIPAEKIIFIRNAVDVDLFRPPSPEEKNETRLKKNIPENCFIYLYIGRLEYIKGLDILIKAFYDTKQHLFDNIQLYIVGDGSILPELMNLVENYNLKNNIHFVGKQENILEWYWASDVFVLPSRSEGFSNSMAEAMACGMVVVCSDVGGALDIIEHGKNGFLFKSEDVSNLSEILEQSFSLNNLRKDIGLAARELIMREASLKSTCQQISDTYNNI